MANFSENAVRHIVVANAAADVDVINVQTGLPVTVESQATTPAKEIYIKHKNAEGIFVKSDTINVENVRAVSIKDYKTPSQKLQEITINKSALTPNTEYSLRVLIREVMSGSSEDQMVGIVSVTTSSTVDTDALLGEVIDGLAKQLNKMYGVLGMNYNKLQWPILVAGNQTPKLMISEVDSEKKPWILGKVQLRNYNFHVTPMPTTGLTSTANTYFESFDWITPAANGDLVLETSGNLGNGYGKVAADLEYFYHGEKGDFYRMANYPYNITTTYMVNPSLSYDTVDIAHFSREQGTSPQASEKQLLVLCETVSKTKTKLETALNLVIK